MPESSPHTLLAADIGGTKTNVACFEAGPQRPRLHCLETYASRDATGLEDILDAFTRKYSVSPAGVCLGIAGPVVRGRSKTTNLPWTVSEAGLRKRFGWERVKLINDLSATALSVPLLQRDRLRFLNRARAEKNGTIGVVAPGTGLGQALLVFEDGRPRAVPSEGGHVDFAPNSEADLELWRFLQAKYGHVSVERVLSGNGLVNIYTWLQHSANSPEPAWLKEKMLSGDPARVITETALAKEHPVCRQALEHFIAILGAVSGNLALTALSSGGIYLGGGIPPKILAALEDGPFLEAFSAKGRYQALLETIPVRVILDSRAPLLGAAFRAQQMLQESHVSFASGRIRPV